MFMFLVQVNTTEIRLESGSGLKNYEEEEEDTVLPYRLEFIPIVSIFVIISFIIMFIISVASYLSWSSSSLGVS